MFKIKALLLVSLLVGVVTLTGCYQATIPTYSPPVTVIQTVPAVTVTPIVQTTIIVGQQNLNQNVVSLSAANHPIPTNPDQDGIGDALVQVTLKVNALSNGSLVAVGSIPIWNSSYNDSVYSITYGIFEQRTDMQPAPSYFSSYISTYSLVSIAGRTWADVPVVLTIPKGSTNLPTDTVYFNIAVHNTNDNGNIQMQGAQRWEISFK